MDAFTLVWRNQSLLQGCSAVERYEGYHQAAMQALAMQLATEDSRQRPLVVLELQTTGFLVVLVADGLLQLCALLTSLLPAPHDVNMTCRWAAVTSLSLRCGPEVVAVGAEAMVQRLLERRSPPDGALARHLAAAAAPSPESPAAQSGRPSH